MRAGLFKLMQRSRSMRLRQAAKRGTIVDEKDN